MAILWVLVGLVAVVVLWLIATFNGLISLKNRTQEAWSDIDVQLKRRYDLIPNLVKTVQGYAKHEKEIFENVTKARSEALGAKGVKEQQKAENQLTEALKSVFAVAENYPQLRATENFQQLQAELTDTEDKIEASRRFYNGNVRDFNTKTQVFPNNMVAGILGFKAFDLFEIEESQKAAAKDAPKVDF
jgi:LemA protein